VVLRRVEIAEARTRTTLTFAGTLMLAAPAFVAATLGPGNRSFASPWFIVGAVAFVGVILCLVLQQLPQLIGEMRVISPRLLLDDEYLQATPAVFKYNLMIYAAHDWEHNLKYVDRLSTVATTAAALLSLQVVSFAAWILGG
jgi:hypothetical protein